jgi:hypothetical protein
MAVCRSDLRAKNRIRPRFNYLGYGARIKQLIGEAGNNPAQGNPVNNELIKEHSYWQPKQLLKKSEFFPEGRTRSTRNKCYAEYFVAKRLDSETGKQQTVAELVAENVSKNVVLLAFIATKPEVRCSGIGTALLKYFRQTVAKENPDSTIFLEVDDPDVVHISESERQVRMRRLNWYLRQGAVMWSGYYEMPNARDKRRRSNKAIFMALPRPNEGVSYVQLQEAALEVLKTAYGISTNHWLYKKVQEQRLPFVGEEEVRHDQCPEALSFLKAQLLDSTKYDAISPEEAIKKYLELERARKLERLNASERKWQSANAAALIHERLAQR